MRRFGKGLGSLTPRLAPLTISQVWIMGLWLGDLPYWVTFLSVHLLASPQPGFSSS